MPAMPIINTLQPIIGTDIHLAIPPPTTAPMPHVVMWGVGLSADMGVPLSQVSSKANNPIAQAANGKMVKPVMATGGHACGRGHDAGPHFGHAAPNALLAILWLGAASKAEFAATSVYTPQGPLAVNMMYAMNLQLDCHDPFPGPSSFAITLDYTVQAGMTWTDLAAGFGHMIADLIVEALLGFVLGMGTALLGSAINRVVKKNALLSAKEIFQDAAEGMMPSVRAIPLREWVAEGKALVSSLKTNPIQRSDVGKAVAESAWNTFADLNIGGPTGADFPWSAWGEYEGGKELDSAVDSAFYPDAQVEQARAIDEATDAPKEEPQLGAGG